MYKIYIRQPWDTTWQRYDHTKAYITVWGAEFAVRKLKKSNWWVDKTEYKITKTTP